MLALGVFAKGSMPSVMTCNLTFPEAANVSQNTIYIPFRVVGRLIAVDASIDTVSGLFIVDTGSSDLLLNENYFESQRTFSSRTAVGVTGEMGELKTRTVDTLNWDLLEIENLEGHVVSLAHIEEKKNIRLIGVLGYEVFRNFEILIDYSIRQLVVTRVDKNGSRYDPGAIFQQPIDSIDFRLQGHVMVIRARINGVKLNLGLDTGAELNLLDVGVKRRVLDNFEILRRVTMTGAGEGEIELIAGILYGIETGIEQKTGMRTLLTRMWRINQAFGSGLDGVLGYEFLFDKRMLINYKKEKLYFFEPIKS